MSKVAFSELDDALLSLVPTKKRDVARLLIRLKTFTPYQHAVADAFEWCKQRQSESDDDRFTIVSDAAQRYFTPIHKKTPEEFAESIHRAWTGWRAINELLRIRAAARQLHRAMQ